jgi:P4 family phage/plasmid primase-like protien
MTFAPENIPQELKDKPQWVAWKGEQRNGKITKPPYNIRTGNYAHSDKSRTWATFDECMRASGYDGIGYVLTRDDAIAFIDLDHCRNAKAGGFNDEARRWIARFNTYAEVSVSGDGVHILARGTVAHSHKSGDYEIYDNTRFFTVSGEHIEGTPLSIEPCQDAIDEFYNEKFAHLDQQPHDKHETTGPGLTTTDSRLLKIARRDSKFAFLFDTSDLSGKVQHKGKEAKVDYASASEADYALVNKLAYYTNGDFERMLRLARASKRLREKWQSGRGGVTWIEREISTAIANMTDGFEDADVLEYLDKKGRVSPDKVAKDILNAYHFLTFEDTEEIFVYDGQAYKENGKAFLKKEIQDRLKHRASNHHVNEIVGIIQRSTFKQRDEAEAPLNLIPLRNGVLNIKTGVMSEYSPDVPFFFVHSGAYIPELLEEDTEAKRFLESTFPAHDEKGTDLPIIQEFAGACHYRKYLYKKALQLIGDGDNGKSLFLTLLILAVGRDAVSTRTLYELGNNRFASADMDHKTANIQADIGGGSIYFTGPFKTFTGNDLISAEKKGLPAFSFVNKATMVFSANELGELKRPDPVFYDRFVLVEMPVTFVDDPTEENERLRDPFLEDKLSDQKESDYFTTWAIAGLIRLLKNGRFTETKGSKDVMARWVSRTDSLKAFVDSSDVEESPGTDITKTAFYEAYVQWCAKNDMAAISKEYVGRRLPGYITTTTKQTKPHSWANIAVKGVEPISSGPELTEPIANGQERLGEP